MPLRSADMLIFRLLSGISGLPDLSNISPGDLPNLSALPDVPNIDLSNLPDLSNISPGDLPDLGGGGRGLGGGSGGGGLGGLGGGSGGGALGGAGGGGNGRGKHVHRGGSGRGSRGGAGGKNSIFINFIQSDFALRKSSIALCLTE
ncbi:hypothetical protein TNCV_4719491 [Trichonephila clavipes]|uniref:Uncharacterized protein n=1 Tax=Trichonephila clavipes TaxID=2585209 RepID=A0A8X7BES9_TRICX|nr:hypothetical protein TNCV_4719491 [Trichonephila clavipes]